MGRNLSPVIQLQLENLDKDPESRILAMKVIKSNLKDLDSKTISIILAQLSEIRETGLTSVEFIVSIYEDIARFHGSLIVPHIHNIMLTIIKTLSSCTDQFDLHQACPKAVSAIARYGVDPMTPDDEKQEIMHSICKPLSDSLLAREENLSSGAALCLQALVELDNWRFCSSQMVNEVCQRVTACLEKPLQSGSHMGLVMALVKCNGLVVEGYARLLARAGVRILNMGVTEDNCHKRLLAIQMVNCLMRSLDYKCIVSELTFLIDELQKFQHDQMVDVKEEASEAIWMAKRILWSDVDVSLKDGLFSGQMSSPGSATGSSETPEDFEDVFTGFLHISPINGDPRSATFSPQRSKPHDNVNNINRSTTPRKPFKSVQVQDGNSCSKSRSRRFRSSSSSKCNYRPDSEHYQNGFTDEDEQFNGTSGSLSSIEDIPTKGNKHCEALVPETKVKSQMLSGVSFYCGFFVLLVAVVCYMWICDVDDGYNFIPT